jgi:hypothetical protein
MAALRLPLCAVSDLARHCKMSRWAIDFTETAIRSFLEASLPGSPGLLDI